MMIIMNAWAILKFYLKNMKTPNKKKAANNYLRAALVWTTSAILLIAISENISWFNYFWFLFPIYYIMLYFFKKKPE